MRIAQFNALLAFSVSLLALSLPQFAWAQDETIRLPAVSGNLKELRELAARKRLADLTTRANGGDRFAQISLGRIYEVENNRGQTTIKSSVKKNGGLSPNIPIVVALMFFGPSSIALLLLYRKKRRQKVAQPNELSKAIACHTFGALLSPGLPIAYFAFVSATCGGGGCGSGVWIILLMPVVWPLWWVGWRASERAFEAEK